MLLAVWVDRRRCPMGLVDLLLENDLPEAADCALWCATKEDRPIGWCSDDYSGPFVCEWNGWYYFVTEDVNEDDHHTAYTLPLYNFNTTIGYTKFKWKTPTEAILWLLSNWITSEVLV